MSKIVGVLCLVSAYSSIFVQMLIANKFHMTKGDGWSTQINYPK